MRLAEDCGRTGDAVAAVVVSVGRCGEALMSRTAGLALLRGRRRRRPMEDGVVAILIALRKERCRRQGAWYGKCEWTELRATGT